MIAAPPSVLIRGGGVAASTVAHLLTEEGFSVCAAHEQPPLQSPVVLLSEAAILLLRDVLDHPTLFSQCHRIERRIVAWGGRAAVAVPHVGAVVSGSDMRAALTALHPPVGTPTAPFSTLHAIAPYPAPALEQFGSRPAWAAEVELAADADEAACLVEATDLGWLFVIPLGDRRAWLLGVGGDIESVPHGSRLVWPSLARVGSVSARFETAPRLLHCLADEGWLACGTGAVGFDPLCGDGTAQAAREGILAAAVITALREGEDSADLLCHYQSMLLAAMRRHLQISLSFYHDGGDSPWWQEQARTTKAGYDWCTERLARQPEPRFLLRGARLIRKETAA